LISFAKCYTHYVADNVVLSRSTIRRAENTELSLVSLEAIAEIRNHLDELEVEAMKSAREKGATVDDIADAIGLTPQAIYHRLRNGGSGKRGRPKAADASH
jgi:predicted transcriptional regulator